MQTSIDALPVVTKDLVLSIEHTHRQLRKWVADNRAKGQELTNKKYGLFSSGKKKRDKEELWIVKGRIGTGSQILAMIETDLSEGLIEGRIPYTLEIHREIVRTVRNTALAMTHYDEDPEVADALRVLDVQLRRTESTSQPKRPDLRIVR